MKVELENAYISIRVNYELVRIAAEKAVVHMNDDGSVYQFNARFLLGTPLDSVLRIGNKTRMRVSFNGGIDQHSFIHSEPGQKIMITDVEFVSKNTSERV